METVKNHSVILLILVIGFIPLVVFSQKSVEPKIIRSVSFEKKRNIGLESAIIKVAGINEVDDRETRYYYNFVDLNGDKQFEALVYIFGGNFCGTGGCDAYLFRKSKNGYKLVTHFEPVRNPIVVSQKKTKGWFDLLFFNSGGGINPGYYSVCRFDGKSYCENPTVSDKVPALTKRIKGVEYLVGKDYRNSGLKFKFTKSK